MGPERHAEKHRLHEVSRSWNCWWFPFPTQGRKYLGHFTRLSGSKIYVLQAVTLKQSQTDTCTTSEYVQAKSICSVNTTNVSCVNIRNMRNFSFPDFSLHGETLVARKAMSHLSCYLINTFTFWAWISSPGKVSVFKPQVGNPLRLHQPSSVQGMPIYWRFDYHSTVNYLETKKRLTKAIFTYWCKYTSSMKLLNTLWRWKKCNSMLHKLRYAHKCFVAHHLTNQVLVKKKKDHMLL